MKQYDIILRKAAIELGVIIRSIPLRIFGEIKSKMTLSENVLEASATKYIKGQKIELPFKSACGSVQKFVSDKVESISFMDSRLISSVFRKYVGADANKAGLGSTVSGACLVKYRLLSDMEVVDGEDGLLSMNDNMSLEDLDYILI